MRGQTVIAAPKKRQVVSAARGLHEQAVRQSRRVAFYSQMGVADPPEGRFEALTLHILLIIDRLRVDGPTEAPLCQALFDVFIGDLDGAMREMGVGDLAMAKRMRKLGEAVYGRAKAFDEAVKSLPDASALRALMRRTVFEGREAGDSAGLTRYVHLSRSELARMNTGEIRGGNLRWGVL